MILGLCGNEGSGKDTAANILVNKHGFIKMSFGSILKDVLASIFDWPRHLLEGDTIESREWREKKDEWWSSVLGFDITPRFALQNIGTEIFRNHFNDNIWVLALEKKLYNIKTQNIVITDCRFSNEMDMLRKYGAKIYWIRRDSITPTWVYDYLEYNKEPSGIHDSKWRWITYSHNGILWNNKNIDELEQNILELI